MSNNAAFDTLAAVYDRDFAESPVSRWLRERVWGWLEPHFPEGSTAFEIGCAGGIDALWMAQRGVKVIAADISPFMLDQTKAKAEAANLGHLVTPLLFDLNHLPEWDSEPVDGVYSNFGPVNCTRDWTGLGRFLARAVKPGGYVGLGVISPFCMWETLWHGLHLDFRTAFRRFKRETIATLPGGGTLPIYYPSPRQFVRAFQPYFQFERVRGLGVFLPPSDAFGVVDKRPRIMKPLIAAETHLADYWPFRTWTDHYWIEFTRTSSHSGD
ncbi:MAG: methyltransferase [Chloroflexota bacterium]|nr:class I SAM-dependent methyltransferase [Chloroflexota bacterium]NOG63084.1 methyltransferase domain-containing protein [Chloroflexota bacterium]GIK62896.1 MAG: methyltransferase [Chloroflexota bacterium]